MNDLQRQQQDSLGDGLPEGGGIHPWWQRWGRRDDMLASVEEDLVRKSFDLPRHDMQANTHNHVGIGAKGVVGAIAASSLLPAALIAGYLLTRNPDPSEPNGTTPVEKPLPDDRDTDTQYEFKTQPGGSQ